METPPLLTCGRETKGHKIMPQVNIEKHFQIVKILQWFCSTISTTQEKLSDILYSLDPSGLD